MKEQIESIVSRSEHVQGRGEEATKQALILPLLAALGYDVWNPNIVRPEYAADFATKKRGQREKVDYAVFRNLEPVIFIEAKAVDEGLAGHQGQLARYFNATQSVRLAILTNGLDYWFFTDTKETNVMDERPFRKINLCDLSNPTLEALDSVSADRFDPNGVRDTATKTIYTSHLTEFMRQFLDLRGREPSEEFVRWVLSTSSIYDGRVTSNVVDRFSPLVKEALSTVHREIVRRSVAAMDLSVDTPNTSNDTEEATEDENSTADDKESTVTTTTDKTRKAKVVTTPEELAAFEIISEIYHENPALSEKFGNLTWVDTTGYFAIVPEKGPSWLIRLSLGGRKSWLGFPVDEGEYTNVTGLLGRMLPSGFNVQFGFTHAKTRLILPKGLENPKDWTGEAGEFIRSTIAKMLATAID
jgi:hypothetical protein